MNIVTSAVVCVMPDESLKLTVDKGLSIHNLSNVLGAIVVLGTLSSLLLLVRKVGSSTPHTAWLALSQLLDDLRELALAVRQVRLAGI